jgi:hypothetical protein
MLCDKCQYFSAGKIFCLLGRDLPSCDSRQARRGDERLVERFRSIVAKEFQEGPVRQSSLSGGSP